MISRILLYLIELYRFIARIIPLPWTCRFWPSCSFFTQEAIRTHGAVRGSWLGIRRILRCNPMSPGGIDLVPQHITYCNGRG